MKWKETPNGLMRSFGFKTYLDSFGFATQIALLAQRLNHHPRLIVEYNRVTVETISHDVGKITDRDHKLAAAVDGLELPAGKQEAEELKLIKAKIKKEKKEKPGKHKKKLLSMKQKLADN